MHYVRLKFTPVLLLALVRLKPNLEPKNLEFSMLVKVVLIHEIAIKHLVVVRPHSGAEQRPQKIFEISAQIIGNLAIGALVFVTKSAKHILVLQLDCRLQVKVHIDSAESAVRVK